MAQGNQPNSIIQDVSPCYKCPERFLTCSDNCPIDARGGFGYKAWKAKVEAIKKAKKDYYEHKTSK